MERYRITNDTAVYYVTFSVIDWLPVFVSEPACKIVTESLNFCHASKSLRVNSYVIMPTHLHAIVFDSGGDPKRLESTLTDFRKFTGRRLADYCDQYCPPCFGAALKAAAPNDRERRFWQPTRHPVGIATEKFWQAKLDYLHDNPCRKGLVRRTIDWRFSSAINFIVNANAENDVILTPLQW